MSQSISEWEEGSQDGSLVSQLVFGTLQTGDVVIGYEKTRLGLSSGTFLTQCNGCFLRLLVDEDSD